jgi:hypothetical protein
MSTIFLARLRRERRYVSHIYDKEPSRRFVERHPEARIFASHPSAERYVAQATPTTNPFCLAEGCFEEDSLLFSYSNGALPMATLIATIDAAGLAPPLWWDEATWEPWWDQVRHERGDIGLDALRAQLGLPNWGENPFRQAQLSYSADMLYLYYPLPYRTLQALTEEATLTPLPAPQSRRVLWEIWWDENAPRMTDEQKAVLWRLLDPEPWEIVEVELEGAP